VTFGVDFRCLRDFGSLLFSDLVKPKEQAFIEPALVLGAENGSLAHFGGGMHMRASPDLGLAKGER